MNDDKTTPSNQAGADLSGGLSHFRPGQATVLQMTLSGGLGVDTVATVRYDGSGGPPGRFFIQARPVPLPAGPEREMSADELRALKGALEQQHHQPHGTPGPDAAALQTFIHLAAMALHRPHAVPSATFDHARFGTIEKDAAGALVATLGIGVDVVGTVHDQHGTLSYEQHPVPMKAGAAHPLSPEDQASLAANLKKYISAQGPAVNPLWQQLLHDIKKQ